MTFFTPAHLLGFRAELQKLAVDPMHAAMGTLGAAGGLVGGYKGYSDARDQGQGMGQALGQGLKGALVGGGAGAAAGAGLSAVKPSWGKSVGDFGQRQVHSVTGWTPKGGLHSIGEGSHDAAQKLEAAHAAHVEAQAAHAAGAAPTKSWMGQETSSAEAVDKARAGVEGAKKGLEAAQTAESRGMTSLPGYLGAVKEHGLLPTLGVSLNQQLHGTSHLDKAMMLGLPAAGLAHAALSQGPDESGQGRGERLGSEIGNVVGGIAGAPLSLVGGQFLQEGGKKMGRLVGKGVDVLQNKMPDTTDPVLATGSHGPALEVEQSSRLAGGGGMQ